MISHTTKHTQNTQTPVYDANIKSKTPITTKEQL